MEKHNSLGPLIEPRALAKVNAMVEDAVAMANDTECGLAAYLYTSDIDRLWRISEAMEYGMVGVNELAITSELVPFGGVKESSLGREGSSYGIDDYVDIKFICMGGIGSA